MKNRPATHVLRDFPIKINIRAVLRHLGYKPSTQIKDRIKGMLDDAVEKAIDLSRPAGIYFIDRISARKQEEVRLECGFAVASRQVVRLLRECREVMVFAATVGTGPEDAVRDMMGDNPAEALLLDSAAGEAAEGAVEYLHHLVRADAHRRGLHLTPRFSPGYGDWPLEAQRDLFSYLEPWKIGIELTESCMMIPRKSVSGILGLGPLPGIRVGASPCKECAKALREDS